MLKSTEGLSAQLSKERFLPVVANRNTLNGIDFIVEDRNKLLYAIRNATADKKAAFAEGTKNAAYFR